MRAALPKVPPQKGEKWDNIFEDFKGNILEGVTHWQHPRFHAYFPAGNSYPSIMGEMLSAGLGIVGFSWAASPACTELETIVLNWLGNMIGLSREFLPLPNDIPSFDVNSNRLEQRDEEAHLGGGVILVIIKNKNSNKNIMVFKSLKNKKRVLPVSVF